MKPNQIKNKKNFSLNKKTVSLLKDTQLNTINGGKVLFQPTVEPTPVTIQLSVFYPPVYN